MESETAELNNFMILFDNTGDASLACSNYPNKIVGQRFCAVTLIIN